MAQRWGRDSGGGWQMETSEHSCALEFGASTRGQGTASVLL